MKKEVLFMLILSIFIVSGCQSIVGGDVSSGGKGVNNYGLVGDFNNNNCIDEEDAILLNGELRNPEQNRNLLFDVNLDGVVNGDDFFILADKVGICACEDGTLPGQCSNSDVYGSPYLCTSDLQFEENCFSCGCPENSRCTAEGYCEIDEEGIKLSMSTEKDTYFVGENIALSSKFKVIFREEFVDVIKSTPNFYKKYQSRILQSLGGPYVKKPITRTDYEGYIVIFNEPSVLDVRESYLRVSAKRVGDGPSLNDEISAHFNSLKETHGSVLGTNERADTLTGFQVRRNLIVKSEYFSLLSGAWVDGSEAEIERIRSSPLVKSVTPSYLYYPILSRSVSEVNADNLVTRENVQLTGRGINIAVLDTGIDYTHEDFGSCDKTQAENNSCPKIIYGYNFVEDNKNILDLVGHGTHVASTIAGNGELKGVAPESRLMIYKVCDDSGCPEGAILAGLERAIDPNQDFQYGDRAEVISMSLGGSAVNPPESDIFTLSIDNAISSGSIVVIAAGNNGPGKETIGSPGIMPKAITVGASCLPDQLWNHESCGTEYPYIAEFSSRGPSFVNDKPDIVAPGVDICAAKGSEIPPDFGEECFDDKHIMLSGTSMATPHVSGAVALIRQAHPEWDYLMVKNALKSTARDLGYPRYVQGSGLTDVGEALNFDRQFKLEITGVSGGDYGPVEGENEEV